jgi:uncharacterized membrane protein YebE (DUF533 family)
MNVQYLVGEVIRGALGVRRKRHRGALDFLVGGPHPLVNAGTLMGAVGVAWGLLETMQAGSGQRTQTVSPPAVPPLPRATAAPPAADDTAKETATSIGTVRKATSTSDAVHASPDIAPDVARVIRLTVSAARADGTLTETEEHAIVAHARTVGAEQIVQDELRTSTALPVLLQGAPAAARDDLYTLAYAIVRADETVSGAERIYLAQLAHQLGLDATAAAALEQQAATRIDAAVSRP